MSYALSGNSDPVPNPAIRRCWDLCSTLIKSSTLLKPLRLPSLLTLLLLSFLSGRGLVGQEPMDGSVAPDMEPRFERLFWSDTLQLMLPGGYPNNLAVSPDGRWIAFEGTGSPDRVNLWLAPSGGGLPVSLTEGQYVDGEPVWDPAGDAVFFRSSRPAGEAQDRMFVMRLPISPDDGHPLGPPRQVTLDLCMSGRAFQVSPDGEWIAYATPSQDGATTLKVVPSMGGTARTVASGPDRWFGIHWSPDARFLYFRDGLGADRMVEVMRVAEGGGDPETVSTWPAPVVLSPGGRHVLSEIPGGGSGESRYRVSAIGGEPHFEFGIPEEFQISGFLQGSDEFLAIRQDQVNPLRVLPVAGGPIRRLNEAWGFDVPLAWTSDGNEIFFETELNGETTFMKAPVGGGTMREVSVPGSILPQTQPVLSTDDRHLLILTESPEDGKQGLAVHDLRTGTTQHIGDGVYPDRPRPGIPLSGANREMEEAGAKFLYWEDRNGAIQARAAHANGSSTLIRRFRENEEPTSIAVHGDRVALARNDQDQGSVLLSDMGGTETSVLVTLPGTIGPSGSNGVVWSPDGRELIVSYAAPEAARTDFLLLEISEDSDLIGEPRILAPEGAPKWWWGLQWLPDGEHFLVNGMGAEGVMDTEIWMLSTDGATPPVALTSDLEEGIWNFLLSPDGRFLTFVGGIPRGSSIWKVTLVEG